MANIQLVEARSNLPTANAPRLNFIATLAFVAPVAVGALATLMTLNPAGAICWRVCWDCFLAQSPKIARQWERAVVLRLVSTWVRGPGLVLDLSVRGQYFGLVDQRVITTAFAAEKKP